MLGLGLGLPQYSLRRAASIWTPAALFAQGQQGAWYEPKPQYLYQDAAGTVPVTADGDPVGYMQDLSGNGNHATQGTSAARPIYRTDGVLHWLEGDGVDDIIFNDSYFIPQPSVLSAAFQVASAVASLDVADSFSDANVTRNALLVRNSQFQSFAGNLLSSGVGVDALPHVMIGEFNGGNSRVHLDGISVSGSAGHRRAHGYTIFSRGDTTINIMGGRFFGGVQVFGDLADKEIRLLKHHLATLAGVSL